MYKALNSVALCHCRDFIDATHRHDSIAMTPSPTFAMTPSPTFRHRDFITAIAGREKIANRSPMSRQWLESRPMQPRIIAPSSAPALPALALPALALPAPALSALALSALVWKVRWPAPAHVGIAVGLPIADCRQLPHDFPLIPQFFVLPLLFPSFFLIAGCHWRHFECHLA